MPETGEGDLSSVRSPMHTMLLLGISVFSMGIIAEGIALALSSGVARWALLVGLAAFVLSLVVWMRMWGEEPVALGAGVEGVRVITRSSAHVVPWSELAVTYTGSRPPRAILHDRRADAPWAIRGSWMVGREDAERVVSAGKGFGVRFE